MTKIRDPDAPSKAPRRDSDADVFDDALSSQEILRAEIPTLLDRGIPLGQSQRLRKRSSGYIDTASHHRLSSPFYSDYLKTTQSFVGSLTTLTAGPIFLPKRPTKGAVKVKEAPTVASLILEQLREVISLKKFYVTEDGKKFSDLFWIHLRIIILTIYCCLHYSLLAAGVWDSPYIRQPPPRPSLHELDLEPGADATLFDHFLDAIHPHVDGHPHLHTTISVAMQRCLGMAAVEWVLALWLSTATAEYRKSLFGLLVSVITFRNITGCCYGGLEHKVVFAPDLWSHIFKQIHLNFTSEFCPVSRLYLPSWLPTTFRRILRYLDCTWRLRVYEKVRPTQVLARFGVALFVVSIIVLDYIGFLLSCLVTCLFFPAKPFGYVLLLLACILGVGRHFLGGIPPPDAGDSHWLDFRKGVNTHFKLRDLSTTQVVYFSKYIDVGNDVKLAADIYVPAEPIAAMVKQIRSKHFGRLYTSHWNLDRVTGAGPSNPSPIKLPTMVTATRYNRRMTVRWPFTMLSLWGQGRGQSTTNVWNWQVVDALVPNGYVVVVVDTRGTGASLGSRPVDFSPNELEDLTKIHEWLSKQFWFDGHVATGGFSYDGMTGLHLAAQRPLDAVLALFTPMDVVHDLIQPGGIVCTSFVEDYTGLTVAFERNGSPLHHMLSNFAYDWQLIVGFLATFGLAAPVVTQEHLLPLAIKQHQRNWNMAALVEELHFSDDFVVLPGSHPEKVLVGSFGIQREVIARVLDNNAAVYIVGGYYDSSSVKGATRLFEALHAEETSTESKHQLTLGPWTHTGRRTSSPYSSGTNSHFELDMYVDIIRFLDCHLKKKCWTLPLRHPEEEGSLMRDAPVHFWSVGEERWLPASRFPPLGVSEVSLSFTAERVSPTLHVAKETPSSAGGQALLKRIAKTLEQKCWERNRCAAILTRLRNALLPGLETIPHNASLPNSYRLERRDASNRNNSQIVYDVDYTATTRGLSRWAIAKHPFRMAVEGYRQLEPQSSRQYARPAFKFSIGDFFNLPVWSSSTNPSTGDLLLFTTPPLQEGLRVVGSPVVRFALNLTDEFRRRSGELIRQFTYENPGLRVNQVMPLPGLDVTVFGYIEDVDPASGKVHYVSEGRVLLSHRPTLAYGEGNSLNSEDWTLCAVPPFRALQSEETPGLKLEPRVGSPDVVYQKGTQADQQFSFGGVECVVFTFEPFAWYFRQGHLLRLSLAGADLANFRWEKTQVKEDADLLARSLLSQIGMTDRLRDLRHRHVRVKRPRVWDIPVSTPSLEGFLRLPVLRDINPTL